MIRLRITIVVVGLLLCPAVSHAAEGDWWTWLEKLSGPGPFKKGHMFSERVFCSLKPKAGGGAAGPVIWSTESDGTTGDDLLPCLRDTNRVKAFVEAAFATATTDRHSLFSDAPNEAPVVARASMLRAQWMQRMYRGGFSAGGGGGILWMSADGYDTVLVPVAMASAMVMPLRFFGDPENNVRRGWLVLRAEEMLVGGFDAKDFGSSSPYSRGAHFLKPTVFVGINLATLLR